MFDFPIDKRMFVLYNLIIEQLFFRIFVRSVEYLYTILFCRLHTADVEFHSRQNSMTVPVMPI